MEIFTFDIETIPNQTIPEECLPQFDESEVKLGNLKDPTKIQEKLSSAKIEFEASLSKKMSIDPALCQVCTFGAARYNIEKDEIVSEYLYQVTDEDAETGDYSAVYDGWQAITDAFHERIPVVSFNGKSFDLPIMLFRAMQQDVPVDIKMFDSLSFKYQNEHHYDLLQLLSGWDRTRWHKLDFYLRLFGIGSKNGIDGSMVYGMFQEKKFDEIKQYCRDDVLSTSALFSRVAPWVLRESKQKELPGKQETKPEIKIEF